MKQQILTLILSLASLTGLHAQETYYEKHVAFPATATAAEKLDMASRLVPTPQQLEWQAMELTAFLHFGVNTFTGREWGDGTEDPNIFNPTALDCEQWVRTLKDAGFKMALITAKHHEAAPAVGTNKGIVLSGKTDKGIPFIDFTLKDATKLTEMVDLVVADQHDQKYSENSGTVNFKFGHILSKVLFKVKLKNALSGNTRIFVKKLEILGTTNNGTSKFYTKAEYKNQHWQYDAANIPATDFDVANIMNVAAVSGVGDYTKTAIEATTSAKSLFKDGEFLFLIPVNDSETPGVETGTTANGEIKVRLTYDAITPDVNDPTNKYLVSETEALVDLPSGALKLGTAYTYTFNLALNPVQVTVDDAITDWKDGTSGDTGDI